MNSLLGLSTLLHSFISFVTMEREHESFQNCYITVHTNSGRSPSENGARVREKNKASKSVEDLPAEWSCCPSTALLKYMTIPRPGHHRNNGVTCHEGDGVYGPVLLLSQGLSKSTVDLSNQPRYAEIKTTKETDPRDVTDVNRISAIVLFISNSAAVVGNEISGSLNSLNLTIRAPSLPGLEEDLRNRRWSTGCPVRPVSELSGHRLMPADTADH
ncbi:hypothetical protein RRG08_060004 [Elysia crispata]|uniref:Uncharacterized protein n=1 Tax=Elysia crispata TaxID=231223 RepID=A0AAE0YE58_9GAST|nr:hypothetical protein RRG08_060004 [Elysia crispata]